MRYKPILMAKVESERAQTKKQEKLKARAGINKQEDVIVREKGIPDLIFGAVRGILYVAVIVLMFVGVVTLLNPLSREILFGIFGL